MEEWYIALLLASCRREKWKNCYIVLLLASCKRERWKNSYIVLFLASCKRERWKNGYIALLLFFYLKLCLSFKFWHNVLIDVSPILFLILSFKD
jgi:hypothetical protein